MKVFILKDIRIHAPSNTNMWIEFIAEYGDNANDYICKTAKITFTDDYYELSEIDIARFPLDFPYKLQRFIKQTLVKYGHLYKMKPKSKE